MTTRSDFAQAGFRCLFKLCLQRLRVCVTPHLRLSSPLHVDMAVMRSRPDVEVVNGTPWQDISIQYSNIITRSGGFSKSVRCPMPLVLCDPNTPANFFRVNKSATWFEKLVMGSANHHHQKQLIKVLDIIRDTLRASFNADTVTTDAALDDDRLSVLIAAIQGLTAPPR